MSSILLSTASTLVAQSKDRLREPLPLDVAAAQRTLVSRIPIDLSPDGEWVAYTYQTDGALPGYQFSTTGVPFTDGALRPQVQLANTRTARVIQLGNATHSSWAPVWSPDGQRVAYYSDEGGDAGLWVWERATGRSERFPGVTVRPQFGSEVVRWMSDSHRLTCQILGAGMTVADANAFLARPKNQRARRFPSAGPDDASVLVRTSKPDDGAENSGGDDVRAYLSDLAILDLRSHVVTRVAKQVRSRWAAFSPDEGLLAYTTVAPRADGSVAYDLLLYDMTKGATRALRRGIRLYAGTEWNWSPDGTRLVYHTEDIYTRKGELVVISIDGTTRSLTAQTQDFAGGHYRAPVWNVNGRSVYAISDGKVWRFDVASAKAEIAAAIPGHQVTGIVSKIGTPTIWTTEKARAGWVVAKADSTGRASMFRVDLSSGTTRATQMLGGVAAGRTMFQLDASDVSNEIAYVAGDQQHLPDVWIFDTKSNRSRQVSRINGDVDRYELGAARVIKWEGREGQQLRGALLLPPGYRPGTRLPLVVWVYGGDMGSDYVNTFGFWSLPTFNMHLLATRGYAVLFPDTPLRKGTPLKDLEATVMSGVDAAIEQGYVDPDRLAIMGQSYGSYCTLAVISQTKRFKAAVITAAVLHPDLFADYLHSHLGLPTRDNTTYYERGQGNMGGTPWEYRDRYLENSPLFRFDQIQTALLIGQGEEDGDLVPSDAIFVALRRLGKTVEYRIYEHEGHIIERKPNVIDFWKRRLEFLGTYLQLAIEGNGAVIFAGGRARPH